MLGVLRCDWSEVASLVGVAVTPVVGFLGNLSREQINPNPNEVRIVVIYALAWYTHNTRTPQRKRRRMTTSALPSSSSSIDEKESSVIGPEDATSEDVSYATLVESAPSVCSLVELPD